MRRPGGTLGSERPGRDRAAAGAGCPDLGPGSRRRLQASLLPYGVQWRRTGLFCFTTGPADSVPRACSSSSDTIAREPSSSPPSTAPSAVRSSRDTPSSPGWIRSCGTSPRPTARANDSSPGHRPRSGWPATWVVPGASPRRRGSSLDFSEIRSTTWWRAIGTSWPAAARNAWFRRPINEPDS